MMWAWGGEGVVCRGGGMEHIKRPQPVFWQIFFCRMGGKMEPVNQYSK